LLGVLGIALLPFILQMAGGRKSDPVLLAWQRFLRRLKKAGLSHQVSDGAMELAAAAAVRLPGSSMEIFHIAELYNRHRYSPQRPEPGEIRRAVKNFHPKRVKT